jgi:undecaprenyl diphosphate synthase
MRTQREGISIVQAKVLPIGERARLHVAIIMDGNGRWAARRGLPRVAGHRAGVGALRRVVERAPDVGIRRLTVYAFSSDNWRRPPQEVESIMWLLRRYLRLEAERLRDRDARIEIIGRRDRLPLALVHEIEKAELLTLEGKRLHLRVAIDYSSRDAIANAALEAVSVVSAERVDVTTMRETLDQTLTRKTGDVDLLIRTGGEQRLSDFLLWECAYAELVFTDRMWPEFDENDLEAALAEFRGRDRRFGGVPAAVERGVVPITEGVR